VHRQRIFYRRALLLALIGGLRANAIGLALGEFLASEFSTGSHGSMDSFDIVLVLPVVALLAA